jgi:hypothetical protein
LKDFLSGITVHFSPVFVWKFHKVKRKVINMAEPFNQQKEDLFFVIENVYSQSGLPGYVIVGDIFFTSVGIYYLSYYSFKHMGAFGVSLATIIGGPLMGVVTASQDDDQTLAIRQAKEKRDTEYGLTIHERYERRKGSRYFIPKYQLEHISFNAMGVLEFRIKEGQLIPFIVKPPIDQYEKTIEKYLSNNLQEDGFLRYKYGFGFPYPAPEKLISLLEAGIEISRESLSRARGDIKYMNLLYRLVRRLPYKKRKKICAPLKHAVPDIASWIVEEAKHNIWTKEILIGGVVGVFFTFLSIVGAIQISNSGETEDWPTIFLFGGIAIFSYLLSLIEFSKTKDVIKLLS